MNELNNQWTEQKPGMDAHSDPATVAHGAKHEDSGIVVAGPDARSRAEQVDPADEDAYWRTHFSTQQYVQPNAPYSDYQSAYCTGYEGYLQHPGKKFEEVETNLQSHYEATKGKSALTWEQARQAAHDAWNRVARVLTGGPEKA